MQKLTIKIITLLLLVFMSCAHNKEIQSLNNGDILFRGNQQRGLSQAINKVTQTTRETNYTHMGICKLANDSVYIIHASSKNGVCMEPLMDFCRPNNDTLYITDIYRLKTELNVNINSALTNAINLIGQPYDDTYIMERPGYYCSEFIYYIFKSDSVFTLNPMTFIDPATGNFHTDWVEHYQKLGVNIPEGMPGCNPNGMAAEGKLDFITRIQ
ncbi:YiiX/YebB-like N1pC/P60 family cysteine hydrolase [Saccharicrinis sp. GN24d3]|uniref:YiiX/YebB-like N1pC/P60 family cysteine hydrolase n=1 Tax=Saccharicrinis sp. GN24d3 TaxID=3458416 RepID=UPI0040370D2D